ncbi:MAG: glutamate-1-semialdehyde 2,1-aminomutase [Betaproteobacteria bacterium]|nr:glutamate-1-semialdehyde 2,1-aminomutase [Betaproteobacteria bacterium]MDE2056723.1 glutamate-1-semialdehyde 2,1-aminomutase [Betaproteobacteria bacterium]
MNTPNEQLFNRAQLVIPGGVNSPVRAFRSVGGTPRFFKKGKGPRFWDAEGREYIDYVCSWGPLLHGHAHPDIVNAVCRVAQDGMSFGAPTELEIDLAERIIGLVPSIEMVRLTSSGTEATMSAIRLARGFTGRTNIIKFDGCYHGHGDALLVKAGSGALTLGQPDSKGIPADLASHTLVLPYNDAHALKECFQRYGEEIAAIIVEPIAGNMNMVLPQREFLQACRELTQEYGAVLIFDEVMTGFRVALGGAQSIYGIQPDLTTLGKVIGGGMPLAAFGGRRDIMEHLAPLGPVYQAGTLSGNPVAVTAGLINLELASEPGLFERLGDMTRAVMDGITEIGTRYGFALSSCSVGGMFGLHFQKECPGNLEQVMKADIALFKRFFHGMLKEGIYMAPSAYEAGFVSSVHGTQELHETLEAAEKVFCELAG